MECNGCKVTRALGIVFEEMAVDLHLLEAVLRNQLIAASRNPMSGIAPAKMHADHHSEWLALDNRCW